MSDQMKATYMKSMEPSRGTKKAKANPTSPKHSPTPYIAFCSEMRPVIKKQHPDMSFGEVAKELGARWKSMDDKTKAAYMKGVTPFEGTAKTKSAPTNRQKSPSPYITFCSKMRAVVKKERPDMSFGEVAKELGARWRRLDTETKSAYALSH
jgi:hypothetical protein